MTSSNGNGKKKAAVIKPKPDVCPYCNGVGFVVPNVPQGDPRFGRAVVCRCKSAEIESRRTENLIKMSQLGALGHLTFEKFMPEGIGLPGHKARNLRMAFERALEFARNPNGWLLLKGGYGCGKTHLAAAIANYRLSQKKPVLFVVTPDLLDHLRSTYHPGSATRYDERFEQIRNAELLILDDLGAHNQSDWAQEKLFQIFNYRYNMRLPTVITTNEEFETLEMRVRSRLSDLSFVQWLAIVAPDFRRGGVSQESDLSSLHMHADKTFETFDLRNDELVRNEAQNLRRGFDLVKNFANDPHGWIVLYSTAFGNGKTHLAAAAANAVSRKGEQVLFIVVPDLLDHLRATFSPQVGARLDQRFNEIRSVPLLVLDDLGTESATAWAREKLYQLFNYRYNAKLPTIITTATPIEEIDPRLASRFYTPMCTFFMLEAPAFRGRGRTRRKNGRKGS